MEAIINELQKNKDVIYNLLKDETENAFKWKQSSKKWCLLEIICHLYDEEREDFRFRTQWVLEKPNQTPPPFNPINWVHERKYLEQDYHNVLMKFTAERERSITWLKSLKDINWEHSFVHPKLGILTAKYFLENWLAHDYLHVRQILKLKFDYLQEHNSNNLEYAGNW